MQPNSTYGTNSAQKGRTYPVKSAFAPCLRAFKAIAPVGWCLLCAAFLIACQDTRNIEEQSSEEHNELNELNAVSENKSIARAANVTAIKTEIKADVANLTHQRSLTPKSATHQPTPPEPEMAAALPDEVPRKPFQPVPGTSWQWQLSGTLNTSYDVAVYDIDLFDIPKTTIQQLQTEGRSVICYFSAGSFEDWRIDASDFTQEVLGKPLGNWPGERWLDIRSPIVRQLMSIRLNLAKLKGCDAVEPDNVDAYTHDTGFPLSAADQLDYNRWLAQQAHERGLSVGLKNNLEQMKELEPEFDFAIVEQCSLYGECERLKVFTASGKAVFRAEYGESLMDDEILRNSLCKISNREGHSTLILPQLLNDRFRFDCLND